MEKLKELRKKHPEQVRFTIQPREDRMRLLGASGTDLEYLYDVRIWIRLVKHIKENGDGSTTCTFWDQALGLIFCCCGRIGTDRLLIGTAAMQQLKVRLDMSQHCLTYNVTDDPVNGHCVVPMSNDGKIFDTFGIDEAPCVDSIRRNPSSSHEPWMTAEWVNELSAATLGPPLPW